MRLQGLQDGVCDFQCTVLVSSNVLSTATDPAPRHLRDGCRCIALFV